MDELTSTFVNESRDQLTAMEDGLLRLEQAPEILGQHGGAGTGVAGAMQGLHRLAPRRRRAVVAQPAADFRFGGGEGSRQAAAQADAEVPRQPP